MVLFKQNGGIFEIPCWSENYSDLGEDWAEKVKKQKNDELETNKEGDAST